VGIRRLRRLENCPTCRRHDAHATLSSKWTAPLELSRLLKYGSEHMQHFTRGHMAAYAAAQ